MEPKIHEPGIYFGLDEAEYHADPALSSSGIRNILISPLDYWAASSMNPAYEDIKTPAMQNGTAFHRRLLEPERFSSIYAAEPQKSDYPGAIDGAEDLRKECERLDVKKGGKISDLCERILAADPRAKLWPVIKESLLEDLKGRTLLKPDVAADLDRTAKIVFAHQSAKMALTGGLSEVSIFWIDPETGIRMKARLDYLKVKAIIDIKTFSNSLSKPIDTAIAMALANGRYDVQAVIYQDAVRAAKTMLHKNKTKAIHCNSGEGVDNDWLVSFASCEQHAFAFVFIEQGAVTNVRVREFRQLETYGGQGASSNMYWQSGHAAYREGVRRYVECLKEFGLDQPWITDEPMKPFRDEEFPLWLFN